MRLELPVRWAESDGESEKLEELTDGKVKAKEPKYTYGRLSISSEDIGPYYDVDKDHTVINDKLGKVYVVAVPFDEFKKIFTEVTGLAIMSIQSVFQANTGGKKRDKNLGLDDLLN